VLQVRFSNANTTTDVYRLGCAARTPHVLRMVVVDEDDDLFDELPHAASTITTATATTDMAR
jgi:hypothetical protein